MLECIQQDEEVAKEILVDSYTIKKYLDKKLNFYKFKDKNIKKQLIDLIRNEALMGEILTETRVDFKYFIRILYQLYPVVFSNVFINRYVKAYLETYKKYQF